jgi:hypothetical protein
MLQKAADSCQEILKSQRPSISTIINSLQSSLSRNFACRACIAEMRPHDPKLAQAATLR